MQNQSLKLYAFLLNSVFGGKLEAYQWCFRCFRFKFILDSAEKFARDNDASLFVRSFSDEEKKKVFYNYVAWLKGLPPPNATSYYFIE